MRWLLAALWASVPINLTIAARMMALPPLVDGLVLWSGIVLGISVFAWVAHRVIDYAEDGRCERPAPRRSSETVIR
jgi:hypothetical protein